MSDAIREVYHRDLGNCFMTWETMIMDAQNPARSKTYVQKPDGEIVEVDRELVSINRHRSSNGTV